MYTVFRPTGAMDFTPLCRIKCRKLSSFNWHIITASVSPVQGNMKQHKLTHKIWDMLSRLFETSKPPPPPVHSSNNDEGSNTEVHTSSLESSLKPDLGMEWSPPEGEAVLPIPKRQPGIIEMWFIFCNFCNYSLFFCLWTTAASGLKFGGRLSASLIKLMG
jgi:hypothetical protein